MDGPWLRHALRYQQSLTREVTTLKGVGWGGVGWGGVGWLQPSWFRAQDLCESRGGVCERKATLKNRIKHILFHFLKFILFY